MRRPSLTPTLIAGTAVYLAVAVVAAAGQATRLDSSEVLIPSLAGHDSYVWYCADCHGPEGRGDGTMAGRLRQPPPDLTRLSQRNGGTFPREWVRGFVDGTLRDPAAHDVTDMPAWGPLFAWFEAAGRAKVRVDNLIAYLETLQQPVIPYDPRDPRR